MIKNETFNFKRIELKKNKTFSSKRIELKKNKTFNFKRIELKKSESIDFYQNLSAQNSQSWINNSKISEPKILLPIKLRGTFSRISPKILSKITWVFNDKKYKNKFISYLKYIYIGVLKFTGFNIL